MKFYWMHLFSLCLFFNFDFMMHPNSIKISDDNDDDNVILVSKYNCSIRFKVVYGVVKSINFTMS